MDRQPNVSAEQWIERFARELGVALPGEDELARMLVLASVAAHSSERRAAPLACWLAGLARLPAADAVVLARRLGED